MRASPSELVPTSPASRSAATLLGPRALELCHLGELKDSAQARWLKTIAVFNDAGEWLRRVAQPTPEQQRLFDQLDITVPAHLE